MSDYQFAYYVKEVNYKNCPHCGAKIPLYTYDYEGDIIVGYHFDCPVCNKWISYLDWENAEKQAKEQANEQINTEH